MEISPNLVPVLGHDPIHSAVSYTLLTCFGILRRLDRAILYTYRLVTFHIHICSWLFLKVKKVVAYINSSFFLMTIYSKFEKYTKQFCEDIMQ